MLGSGPTHPLRALSCELAGKLVPTMTVHTLHTHNTYTQTCCTHHCTILQRAVQYRTATSSCCVQHPILSTCAQCTSLPPYTLQCVIYSIIIIIIITTITITTILYILLLLFINPPPPPYPPNQIQLQIHLTPPPLSRRPSATGTVLSMRTTTKYSTPRTFPLIQRRGRAPSESGRRWYGRETATP